MFIESSSFAASAIAGTRVVTAGLAFLAVATPLGWVYLIVAGALIVGTAAFVSTKVNTAVRGKSGAWYDSIME